jgi:hypothetical protein
MVMDQGKQLQDILEIVTFVRDNAATKEDLERFATKEDLERFATKEFLDEKLAETKNELMNHIDTFIGLHQKLDIELTALRSKYDRLETSMKKVLDHLHLQA